MHLKLLACIRPPDVTFTSLFKLLTLVVNASGLSHETRFFLPPPPHSPSFTLLQPSNSISFLLFFKAAKCSFVYARKKSGHSTSGRETIFLTTTMTSWKNRGEDDFFNLYWLYLFYAFFVFFVCVPRLDWKHWQEQMVEMAYLSR